MKEKQVRRIVLETLLDAMSGTVKNEPQKTGDGDEYNHYVFDGEEFRDNVQRLLTELSDQGVRQHVRHVIDMDGTTHGPNYSDAECCMDHGDVSLDRMMQCGHRCVSCRDGLVHWQPIHGGYYFRCDLCDRTGIDPANLN